MLSVARIERDEEEHNSRSWFVGHLIACTGFFDKKPDLKKILNALNAPYDPKAYAKPLSTAADWAELDKAVSSG